MGETGLKAIPTAGLPVHSHCLSLSMATAKQHSPQKFARGKRIEAVALFGHLGHRSESRRARAAERTSRMNWQRPLGVARALIVPISRLVVACLS